MFFPNTISAHGLAKTLVQVFPQDVLEKPEQMFWTTQYNKLMNIKKKRGSQIYRELVALYSIVITIGEREGGRDYKGIGH